jgi:hypothetical protein
MEGAEDSPVIVCRVAVPGNTGYVAGGHVENRLGVAGFVWYKCQSISSGEFLSEYDIPVL